MYGAPSNTQLAWISVQKKKEKASRAVPKGCEQRADLIIINV